MADWPSRLQIVDCRLMIVGKLPEHMNSVNGSGSRMFLLSPAHCGGNRARIVMSERATFDLAARLRAPRRRPDRRSLQLPERSLLSRQARVRAGVRGAAGSGVPDQRQRRLRHHSHRGAPLGGYGRDPRRAAAIRKGRCRSGRRRAIAGRSSRAPGHSPRISGRTATSSCSAASRRRSTSTCCSRSSGRGCVFPAEFVGRGDMSRGGLLLRCVASGEQLTYVPVAGAVRHGQRPPKLDPKTRPTMMACRARLGHPRVRNGNAAR